MPEGHTIHRLARQQRRWLVGERVQVSSPQGRFAAGAAVLDGRVVDATDAWGKHLFHRYGDDWLHVHLGLYGKFRDGERPEPEPRGALRMRVVTESRWLDLRGPIACEVLSAAGRDAVLARLGPDPLRQRPDAEAFITRAASSRAPIGTLLMDQSVIAGVGNVYRAEVLFRQGLHPGRPGRSLHAPALWAVWDDLTVLLRAGVRAGRIVTTEPGDRQRTTGRARRDDAHYVYGRADLPCRRCLTAVRSADLAGRRLFWCPTCQPEPA